MNVELITFRFVLTMTVADAIMVMVCLNLDFYSGLVLINLLDLESEHHVLTYNTFTNFHVSPPFEAFFRLFRTGLSQGNLTRRLLFD